MIFILVWKHKSHNNNNNKIHTIDLKLTEAVEQANISGRGSQSSILYERKAKILSFCHHSIPMLVMLNTMWSILEKIEHVVANLQSLMLCSRWGMHGSYLHRESCLCGNTGVRTVLIWLPKHWNLCIKVLELYDTSTASHPWCNKIWFTHYRFHSIRYFSEKKELAEKKKEQARERRLDEGEVGSDDDSGASSVADEEFEEFMGELFKLSLKRLAVWVTLWNVIRNLDRQDDTVNCVYIQPQRGKRRGKAN